MRLTSELFNIIGLSDIDLLEVGNEIQLWGSIYSGNGRIYYIPLPDEDPRDPEQLVQHLLVMNAHELERFFNQTDLLNVEGPAKVILRKSQRRIDSHMAWRVFERDGYRCRYCGEKQPLTVDHIDLWEDGGATVELNLVAACRRCNKLRGRTPYAKWLESGDYRRVSGALSPDVRIANRALVGKLPELMAMRVSKVRSR